MELDSRSRAFVITFPCTEGEFNSDQLNPLMKMGNVSKAHGIFSKSNGTMSAFVHFRWQVRSSAISTAMDRESIVIKRVTASELTSFMKLPFDRSFDVTIPVDQPVKAEPSTNVDVSNSSDEELELLIKRRRCLKRKLKEMLTIEREVNSLNDEIKQRLI
jgi:hypothetical protein